MLDHTVAAAALGLFIVTMVLVRRVRRVRVKRTVTKRRGGGYEYRKHLLTLWARDAGICQLCGRIIDSTLSHPHPYSVSIDHIVPVSLGGTHDISNLRIAHLVCNLKRGVGILRRKRKR